MELNQIQENVVTNGGKKMYQGLAKLIPVAVNPTKEQLGKILGTEIEREINYDNGDTFRLDFWTREVNVNKFIKFSIFISNEDVVSKSGNNQYINNFGKTGYFKDLDAITAKNEKATEEWQKMKMDGIRVAKKGESTLYEFLIALYNASNTKPFPQFESWKKLAAGSLTEIKDVITDAASKERKFHLLVGVKDGKYQDAWTSMFLPELFTAKTEQYFFNKAADVDYPFKSDWGNDLVFREYIPLEVPEGVEEESTVADDLPF